MKLWMTTVCLFYVMVGCGLGQTSSAVQGDSLQVSGLRCEYRVDPLGLDVTEPRLSWILDSSRRGERQTAYRVLVASSLQELKADRGDLWDSGRIASDVTTAIVYTGAPLTSRQECYWKVQVWDRDGVPSHWSPAAHWSMGLLETEDWQAQWIGLDVPEASDEIPTVLAQAQWIWGDANARLGTPLGPSYFRRTFTITAARSLKRAVAYITADDSFVLYLNGQEVHQGSGHTSIQEIAINDWLVPGRNVLAVQATNGGQTANPAGLLVAVSLTSEDGQVQEIVSDGQWRVTSQAVPQWQAVSCDDSDWSQAQELGALGDSPWQATGFKRQILPPARYLRRNCQVASQPIARARLHATALGIYQLYLNGQRVTPDYFSPGWIDYTRRLYYRTYDVTDRLQTGDNTLGAILADGWYAGYIGYRAERNHYGQDLRLLCQLEIEYQDGTRQIVGTDSNWSGSLGPIQRADFLQGEVYDARLEMPGWHTSGYAAAQWQSVAVGCHEVQPRLQAAVNGPVMVFSEVKPVAVTEPTPGHYVFDMGQNFAGVVRIRVQGNPGQEITLRHAERLNPDGTLYTTNLRTAAAEDTYICKGGGEECWQPYFTFHGFQYVELAGLEYQPSLDSVLGLALSSDTPVTGTFACSDAMVNQLQSNAVWTQRANFIDIPTDCPQRDERLGWTGDAQVYINTACYHNDVQAFFTKWLTDLTDAQRDDGQFPMVAPLKVAGADGGPAWADAGVICPWTIYQMYGDKRILATHYEAMQRFITFCKNRCADDLLPPSQFHCFGDWLNINDNTPKDVIYMAYFGYCTDLMVRIAVVLGHDEDAAEYRDLFARIKHSFNQAYVEADGKIKGDTQAAYVLALAYDLLEGNMRDLAAKHLIRRIEECHGHLSTGFIGTKDLMLVLAKIGRNDIAYQLLHNETFPSWGFSIRQGATSIWERWNGWTPEQGFGDPGMNSFAHYSFGAVCQWMFENIGGIQTTGPGFKHILLKPQPGGKLTWAKTRYDSIRGTIRTDWHLQDGAFQCQVTVPPNTTATLVLPASGPESVQESGVSLDQAEGIVSFAYESGVIKVELGSGDYDFETR